MICADETPQQAQIKQKRIFDKKTADAKAYSVFVFQEVVPPKGTNKLLRNLAWPTAKTEVYLSGRAFEHRKPGSL